MITLVSSTNRPDNFTNKIAYLNKEILKEEGVDSQILELENLPSDFLISDMYGKRSENVEKIISRYIEGINFFIFIVPEYNGSFPGILKLFIDGLNPELLHFKKAGLIGLSAGHNGNVRGLDHLSSIFHYLNMTVIPEMPKISSISENLDENGNITNKKMIEGLRKHARVVSRHINEK
ncbi:MAG: NADPH-dependent FMN reductase [Flavobacteriales bacterium]